MVRTPKPFPSHFTLFYFFIREEEIMKKRERSVEDYEKIRKLIAYMDFATRIKIAQEESKKEREKKSDK